MERIMTKHLKNRAAEYIFLFGAVFCFFMLSAMVFFLLSESLPALSHTGIIGFITGREWKPSAGKYGVFPMIVGSIAVVVPAAALGALCGVSAAVFLTYYCTEKIYDLIRPVIELMAGIPSIIYGLFCLDAVVPVIRRIFGGDGSCILTAALLLGMMITPTVAAVSEAALRSADGSWYSGALALGAAKEECVFRVMLPSARNGIFAGILLGTGRAVGETMAVMMIAGNQARLPSGILDGVRTLTTGIALEIGYASGLHRSALIASALLLLVLVLLIYLLAAALRERTQDL